MTVDTETVKETLIYRTRKNTDGASVDGPHSV